jgi:transaldolase
LFKAAKLPQYRPLVDEAMAYARENSPEGAARTALFMDKLGTNFGTEILKLIPGRVSTEVDASFSFDTEGTLKKARELIALYAKAGIAKERILIKIASTWEGIRAAEQLEKEGIHCNLTLLFSFAQAVACAQAKVTLISPFVGRIYDWYKKAKGVEDIAVSEDPGVASVSRIYTYYKKYGYATQVMGASFRKPEQVVALAGTDLVTVSPELLEKLSASGQPVTPALTPEAARAADVPKLDLDEKTYRFMHNDDPMAVEKLSEGIRLFYQDARKLEQWADATLAKANAA